MASVTGRIKQIKQPRGGFVKPSEFKVVIEKDNGELNPKENIHGTIVGMAVDYLTRFSMGTDILESFKISIRGAAIAEQLGVEGSVNIAANLVDGINGLDEESIINACKLVAFDVWLRNPLGAMMAKDYKSINPDEATVQNIHTLVIRSIDFFQKYGPITKDGFTFEPPGSDIEDFAKIMKSNEGVLGGYTSTVESGDGDFLTSDTLWDFKVSKSKPTNKHTLQLLMYWIMGQHSGQEAFRGITKLGIFNPRLNTVYLLDMADVSQEIIEAVEDEVICY